MTDRDKVFVDEYLIDLNPKAAALRAGYKLSTARKAHEWIDDEHPTKPAVRDAIAEAMAERSRRTGISQDRILYEIAKVAFLDPKRLFDMDTGMVRADARPEDTACITSINVGSKGREFKLADKLKALELLMKHNGMLNKSLKLEGAIPVVVDDIK